MQAPNAPHSWSWLTSLYMPNPRFGYSVDLNEDGTLLVIGCPTDSIGATDDGILWYKPGQNLMIQINGSPMLMQEQESFTS